MATPGRPSKGVNARVHTGAVKLTRTEVDNLTLRYGTVSAGLRHLVDTVLHGKAPDAAKPHRHMRGMPVSERWEAGSRIITYKCAIEGCDQHLEGR